MSLLEIHIDVAQKWAWLRPSQCVGLPGCEVALLRLWARSQDFDTAMADPGNAHVAVPHRLVDELNHSRPLCPHHPKATGCKKGGNCPLKHVGPNAKGDRENLCRIPYVSINRTDAGDVKCVIRAPMLEAFKHLFEQHRVPQRVG